MASTQQNPAPKSPRIKPDTGKRVVQPKGDITRLPRPTLGTTAVRIQALAREPIPNQDGEK